MQTSEPETTVDAIDDLDRRYSRRWFSNKTIAWRRDHSKRLRHGRVHERSLNGMVIATTSNDHAQVGDHLWPSDERTGVRHGFRRAVVRRTDAKPDGRTFLYVEILA